MITRAGMYERHGPRSRVTFGFPRIRNHSNRLGPKLTVTPGRRAPTSRSALEYRGPRGRGIAPRCFPPKSVMIAANWLWENAWLVPVTQMASHTHSRSHR